MWSLSVKSICCQENRNDPLNYFIYLSYVIRSEVLGFSAPHRLRHKRPAGWQLCNEVIISATHVCSRTTLTRAVIHLQKEKKNGFKKVPKDANLSQSHPQIYNTWLKKMQCPEWIKFRTEVARNQMKIKNHDGSRGIYCRLSASAACVWMCVWLSVRNRPVRHKVLTLPH